MKVLFAALLVVHALIHLMGTAKAVGLADLPQLTHPITRPLGLLWLLAAILLLATAASLIAWPRWWWAVGAGAVIVSQIAIASSWSDARYGTIVNAIILLGVVLGFAGQGPLSFRAQYEREVRNRLRAGPPPSALTESDLATLPAAVQRYVRLSGAVGQPRVWNFRARYHGQIRNGPASRWMAYTTEQFSSYGDPSRLALFRASLFGVPVEALHVYAGSTATMRIKAASIIPVTNARGPEMDRAETVTLFNDMCFFAPATLIDPNIRWREIDARSVEATFTNAGHVVRAVLSFNDRGELADFVSDDRSMAPAGGEPFVRMRWSTPVSQRRSFGPFTLVARGEARWHAPEGDYAYIRFDVDTIEYNVLPLTAP